MRFLIILLFTILCGYSYSQEENYPIPTQTQELLFYIQRNHNANTIIYDANFDKEGDLLNNNPIDVYWCRYEEESQRMELRSPERWYAYGVTCDKVKSEPVYKVELVAEKEKEFWLKQTAAYNAILVTEIDDKLSKLEHLYIFADNAGIWPIVKYIELFGIDLQTGEETKQKIILE